MEPQMKQSAKLTLEAVEASEMAMVSGGQYDYSNRLGMLGEMLEANQDRHYGNPFGAKTLDEAAHQALEGWVSIP